MQENMKNAKVWIQFAQHPRLEKYSCELSADGAASAFYGVSEIIRKLAEETNMPLECTVAKLATILLASGQNQKGDN